MKYAHIVILTGAGISAESGLGTFRDKDGAWTKYDLEDVATPQGFARNPALVHDFYNKRRRDMVSARPNAGHYALARLEQAIKTEGAQLTLITQNVDNLHEKAGSGNVVHMHGELGKALCASCNWRGEWLVDMEVGTPCPQCAHDGRIRPDVVWFGEMPYHVEEIYAALETCDYFLSIGTSGSVYPAAGFVNDAKALGAYTMELTLDPSDNAHVFNNGLYGPASETVPFWVEKLIAGT